MSSYTSLSRVLSPFRVQTKIEENTSHIFKMRKALTCFVTGRTFDEFTIVVADEIPIDNSSVPINYFTVALLKKHIWKEISYDFEGSGIGPNRLNLWKVEIPISEENKKILENPEIEYIKQTFSLKELNLKKLSPGDMFLDEGVFPDKYAPPQCHIHIIVEAPSPATTGKRRLEDSDEGQDSKRAKLADLNITSTTRKIMEDIMKLDENESIYSDPRNFLSLPYPFPGEKLPIDRFDINHGVFTFMGRKEFEQVLKSINELQSRKYMKLFVYGTVGYGKSHILSAIACFLFRKRRRVAFLPDCRQLAVDPAKYIKYALFLTYNDDCTKISEINACKNFDQIIEFCISLDEKLYFIVDQMNALDEFDETGISLGVKQQIKRDIDRMVDNHFYIMSSSANNITMLHLMQKQAGELKIKLFGGFDEDEMLQWWIKNSSNLPSMDDEQKKKIEYITGRNPLFLSFLPGSEKNFEDTLNHLKPILIEKIKMPMTNFSDLVKSERWDTHVKLMSSCLTNGYAPSGYGINDYDHRFFYIDKDERCYYTSGFVRDCMADHLFEKGKLEVFATSSWIKCIKEFRNNPSVKGFIVEKACLSSIYKNGLVADAINFKCDNYKFFTTIEEIDFSTNEGLCTFYLPRLWNQKSIDGLITLFKMKNKKEKVEENTLYIAPIQIALSKETHSDSEASFFSGIWPGLKSKILGDLKAEVIFIWITRENDVDYFVEANKKKLKQRTIEINPQYTSIVKTFSCVNIELENILS